MTLNADAMHSWSVVATSAEVATGEIVQAFLHGQELALWRNAAGEIQIWANRCPHRGTRFTLGRIVDDQLSCGYHGWRFGSGGLCTYIPAHPKLQPPKNVCAKTYPAVERYGMIWASLGAPVAEPPHLPALADVGQHAVFCRSFVIYQSAEKVMYQLQQLAADRYESPESNVLVGQDGNGGTITVLLQPMAEGKSIAHLWASSSDATEDVNSVRQRNNAYFKQHRQQLEACV
ncbi:(2Fe-2S)-binding protein [Herminiimonas sp. KBW02]|uniref:Rieske (2Fe-2S) protein n=1 Tax=Herminiimonas sp. KBW02 TaxID=2153363 RepID=UPI000F5993B5|nr:Rieske (2Fe-2S) protein [Herminiimonas sp. KBW02]RQO36414.1 (2Fe-2S)-binding protein [Herminiimonas sp. KBW02]